jgi:hypothetical protein
VQQPIRQPLLNARRAGAEPFRRANSSLGSAGVAARCERATADDANRSLAHTRPRVPPRDVIDGFRRNRPLAAALRAGNDPSWLASEQALCFAPVQETVR